MEPSWDCWAGLEHRVAHCNIGITRSLSVYFASLISGGEELLSSILSSIFQVMIITTPYKHEYVVTCFLMRDPFIWSQSCGSLDELAMLLT